jgi:hypothetical protein
MSDKPATAEDLARIRKAIDEIEERLAQLRRALDRAIKQQSIGTS